MGSFPTSSFLFPHLKKKDWVKKSQLISTRSSMWYLQPDIGAEWNCQDGLYYYINRKHNLPATLYCFEINISELLYTHHQESTSKYNTYGTFYTLSE